MEEKVKAVPSAAGSSEEVKKLKSNAKAAGLKSIFTIKDGELLMTSYGQRSEAILEKRIIDGKVTDVAEKPAFYAAPQPVGHFVIKGRDRTGTADDPDHRAPESNGAGDLVHTREALEKRYFNSTFRDNIHIQLIHNILDIEKIMVLHINNIIFEINNMFRTEGDDVDDLIGYLSLYKTYENLVTPIKGSDDKAVQKEKDRKRIADLFDNLCRNRRLSYFGLEVLPPESDRNTTVQVHKAEKGKTNKRENPTIKLERSELFYMLKVLSQLRQDMAHGNPSNVIFRQQIQPLSEGKKEEVKLSGSMDDMLATLMKKMNTRQAAPVQKKVQTQLDPQDLSVERVLTKLYRDRVGELNRKFITTSGVNLTLLFKVFGITDPEEKEKYVKDYYEFIVCKGFKNLGFSIKLLREHMAAEIPEAEDIKSKDYDTVRGKLYQFLDFAIFHHYDSQEERKKELVASLRASRNEKEKEKIYSDEAQKLWPEIQDLVLHHILPLMKGEKIGEVKKSGIDPLLQSFSIDEVSISRDAYFFCKLIYLMTIFLNGKEINDLLTNLIHQFDSIASFQEVMEKEGMPWKVSDKFDIFNVSRNASKQLRIINSFARMRQEDPFAKEIMFREAVEVLGYTMSEKEMEQLSREIMDTKISVKGSQNHGVRNFIINNVITSDRFLYLARYSNVKTVNKLVENRALVRFILADIPDAQILRYYIPCVSSQPADGDKMREALADCICSLNFDSLRDVRQGEVKAGPDKLKKIAVVRLYLTVLYQAVKQLVYINARYFLAFHCLERDRILHDKEKWRKEFGKDNNKYMPEFAYKVFAVDFLKKYPPKGRPKYYLAQNIANSDDWAISAFRNKVDHLDAIRNAGKYIRDLKHFDNWYEVYHFILQKRLREQYERDSTEESTVFPGTMKCDHLEPMTEKYFANLERYGTYCKDFVKALCVPFAYNLPRYKNLAIDGMFDKNKPGKNMDPAPEKDEE